MNGQTTESGTCECSCGAPTSRRFAQGHDARLKGRLLAQARTARRRDTKSKAVGELADRGWLRDSQREEFAEYLKGKA